MFIILEEYKLLCVFFFDSYVFLGLFMRKNNFLINKKVYSSFTIDTYAL